MDNVQRQAQLEKSFIRLTNEVIKPTMYRLGETLRQNGHAFAVSEHNMMKSQVFNFVIETAFEWDSAVSLHLAPRQPRVGTPTLRTPTMAFMMGIAHTKIYYKSNFTDDLGRQSDKYAFDLLDLTDDRIEAQLIESLGKFVSMYGNAGGDAENTPRFN